MANGSFSEELKVFQEHHDEWLRSNPGKFVAIQGGQVIDTGAGISVVSKTFARTSKLRLTSEGSKIKTLGAMLEGAEYAASVSFPETGLRPLVPIRLFSGDFIREPFSCLIGRDILQYWKVTFDGPGRRVWITD